MKRLVNEIAQTLAARINCANSGNSEWFVKHYEYLDKLIQRLPSGSGFDAGTTLGDESTPEKLVFVTAFYHMDDMGGYDEWTNHIVRVSASLVHGFRITISGKDKNNIKDYIGECFEIALNEDVIL